MGKALLLIVLGASVILSHQLFSTSETERRTGAHQAAYQEEVIAREIAASAFNVAMGEVRAFGEDIKTGAESFNGADGRQTGTYAQGRFAGGSYETHAEITSGHSVRVISVGRFGDAEFTMHDEYRVPVLIAREDGIVVPTPNVSDPDECSAIFYQAYPIGVAAADLPEPEMIYASSGLSRSGEPVLQSIYATAGTQMNFFIALDNDCSMQIDTSTDVCAAVVEAHNHTFDAGEWDAIHYALEIDASNVDQAEEAPWSIVEQHADDRQSWRISWEDTADKWDAPDEKDPYSSLQALKMRGYDGNGWTLASGTAFVSIGDQGEDRPDFADQSLSIKLLATDFGDPSDSNYHGKVTSFFAKNKGFIDQQKACGLEEDELLVEPDEDLDLDGDSVIDIPAGEESTEPETTEPDDEEVEDTLTEADLIDFACSCTDNGRKDHKTAVLHRQPGETKEVLICVGNPSLAQGHTLRGHNDIFPSCEAGTNIVKNNDKKGKK